MAAMNVMSARVWIIRTTLVVTALCFGFFLLAPAVGYPLTFDQSLRLLEIVTPVFFAYLGSASYFVFSRSASGPDVTVRGSSELFTLILKGPVYVFGIAILAAVVAFGYSNRIAATTGSGMSVDALAGSISGALGLLAVTTNVLVSYLFSSGEGDAEQPVDA